MIPVKEEKGVVIQYSNVSAQDVFLSNSYFLKDMMKDRTNKRMSLEE